MQDYTPKEVAELLKVTKETVWRWIRVGKLKATRLGGTGSYRISTEALNDFKVN